MRYLMHLSMDGCSSCRETLLAALLRCCCRAAPANMDLLHIRPIRGHHQQHMVRFKDLQHGAHGLHGIGSSLRRSLRYGGDASYIRIISFHQKHAEGSLMSLG